jgi:hypothetical protein
MKGLSMAKRNITMALVVLCCVVLAGCAPGDGTYVKDTPAGFLAGLWHGWIAPVTLIVGLFNHSIRIYEVNNSGWWYDLGFYVAVIGGFGGIALTRRKTSHRKK